MPDIITDADAGLHALTTASRYKFSGVGLDALVGASEYTLATIVADVSGSVTSYQKELEKCLQTILKSCQSSPRSDNLLLRLVSFNQKVTEIHGFRLLNTIDPSEYDGALTTGGNTALFDAAFTAIEATGDYGALLVEQGDMSANAVIYIMTDGMDNESKNSAKSISNAINKIVKDEKLESIAAILIGLGYNDGSTTAYLDAIQKEAGITQFVDLSELFTKASPDKALAKLAGFISKSISSTSRALASGSATPSSSLLVF